MISYGQGYFLLRRGMSKRTLVNRETGGLIGDPPQRISEAFQRSISKKEIAIAY